MSSTDDNKASDSLGDHSPPLGEIPSLENDTPVEQRVSPVFDERTPSFFKIITEHSSDSSGAMSNESEGSQNASPGIDQTFGRFQLRRHLGAGGCGSVFLAFDPKLRRDVALKLPNLNVVGSPRNQARFLREAQAVSTLNHPNIVQVHDVDYVGSIPYIVSTLCNGPSLAAWLAGQMRCGEITSPQIAAAWMVEIASAVDYAHQHGIIHRDLKPGNILLSIEGDVDDPASFVPLVTDFGFAKILNADTEFTQTGTVLGTVSHLAPEQAQDPDREIGPAVDIYSLGVVLYELLTGLLPIHGKSAVQILQRLVSEEPNPPRATHPEIPRDLEAVCLKCLAKLPEDRYLSAGELSADLQRFLGGEAVRARPIGRARRLARRANRVRFSWKPVSAIMVGLSATILLAIGLWIQLGDRNESIKDLSLRSSFSNQRLDVLQSARDTRLRIGYAIDIQKASTKWAQATESPGSDPSITSEMERLLQPYYPLKNDTDMRGPGWHSLWNASHPAKYSPKWEARRTIPAHKGEVFGLAFSHDGRRFASAAADGMVRIWNAETGDLLKTLRGHQEEVNWTSWSPDGQLLASASDDRTVRVWNVASGKPVAVLDGFEGWTYTSEFSPDGKRIAASDHTGLLRIWRTSDFRELHTIQAHHDRIRYLAWSPSGQTLTTVSDESMIRIWDAETLKQKHDVNFGISNRLAVSVAYSSDGRLVAIGGETNAASAYDGAILVLDVESGREVARTTDFESRVRSLSFVPGRLVVVSTTDDDPILAWDLVTGQRWKPVQELPSRSRKLTFSRDGAKFAVGCEDGTIWVWDSRAGSDWTHVFSSPDRITYLESLPHTNTVFSGVANDDSDQLTKWDFRTPFPRAVETFDCVGIQGGQVSPSGDELFVASTGPEGPQIVVVGTESLELEDNLLESGDVQMNPSLVPYMVAVPHRGSTIGILSDHSDIDSHHSYLTYFDRQNKRAISQFSFSGSSVCPLSPIAISHDGELVAIGTNTHFDHLWQAKIVDVMTQTEIAVLDDFGQMTMAFGPGDVLAVGENYGRVSFWNVRNKKKLSSFSVGDRQINSLAFFPDGRHLVAATESELLVLDFPDGRESYRLNLPIGAKFEWQPKSMLQVTADGTIVAVVSFAGRDNMIAWRRQPARGE